MAYAGHHKGIIIRIGAAYDEVVVGTPGNYTVFDRAGMRQDGRKADVHNLRRAVVNAVMGKSKRRAA